MNSEITYEDEWGEIIHRQSAGILEIRWFDSTEEMTGDQFNGWLVTFASTVESTLVHRCFVDVIQFKMSPQKMNVGWRDENIIPRYNKAGVEKFAFLMPTGMPLIGQSPAPEGPAKFPTGYFDTRATALSWLTDR